MTVTVFRLEQSARRLLRAGFSLAAVPPTPRWQLLPGLQFAVARRSSSPLTADINAAGRMRKMDALMMLSRMLKVLFSMMKS